MGSHGASGDHRLLKDRTEGGRLLAGEVSSAQPRKDKMIKDPSRADYQLRILTYTAPGMVLPHSLADMRHALCQLGHTVFVQDLEDISRHSPATHTLDIAVIDGVISVDPDYIVTIDSAGLVPAYLAAIEGRRKYVSWFFDDPIQNFSAKKMSFAPIAPDYHLFSWDRAYLPALREMGLLHCGYMPFGTNTEVHYPRARGQYTYDVSFVGHCTPQRMAVLHGLAEAGIPVDIFGDENWGRLEHPNLRFHGHARNREDAPEIYSRSKINLNVTNAQLLTSLPVRVFDVLACEGFLLTDYRQDVTELFRPGKDLALYTGLPDLIQKVQYYLKQPGEREQIAATGRQRIEEQFTFRKQLSSILDQVQNSEKIEDGPELPEEEALLALWLTGLGYLKFGRYAEAERQLLSAHRLEPNEPSPLFALAVLANHTHQHSAVVEWMNRLADGGHQLASYRDDLLHATSIGRKVECWDLLYQDLGNLDLRDDGTVAGWEPKRVEDSRTGAQAISQR
jgi:hypothetical protein